MEKNNQNNKKSNSEVVPFNISKLSSIQYIKVIYIGTDKELYEIRTELSAMNNDRILLYYNSKENLNVTCPTGVALKLITRDAIYFAKTILNYVEKTKTKSILTLNTPQKTIRQQNREFYRINIVRPCVLLINDKKNDTFNYVAQTVNLSKGGVLIDNVESMLCDDKDALKLSKGDCCHMVLCLEPDLKIKLYAKFIRVEYIDNTYRYAFQFADIPPEYALPFDKYITNEELKMLKSIKNL